MENKEQEIAERLEAATTLLERTLSWLEERQGALSGEVEKISATVEQSRREAELAEKLAAAERELAELKAGAAPECVESAAQDAAPRPPARCWPSTASARVRWTCGPWMRRWPAEPGTAHRGEEPTAAGRRDRVKQQLLQLQLISR
jgi:hypothetical protein